jgi:hypothetical protein
VEEVMRVLLIDDEQFTLSCYKSLRDPEYKLEYKIGNEAPQNSFSLNYIVDLKYPS